MKNYASTNWTYKRAIPDGERYEIDGLNIWDHHWHNTGESIFINDPIYHQPYSFIVYQITASDQTIRFAAGEFSNCVWGIYQET